MDGLKFLEALGEGSNGCVLSVLIPSLYPAPVALKILSHFWSNDAKKIMDCERRSLERVPAHPSIIALMSPPFQGPIPRALVPHLTPDMRVAAFRDTSSSTTFFPLEMHPSVLSTWRGAWPTLPFPYHLLWRIARDLLAGVAHLSRHRVVHMDLKLDNVLVSYSGGGVLSDFGISAVFPPGAPSLTLQYKEPLGILVNKSVLPPELLLALERARGAWAETGGGGVGGGGGDGSESEGEGALGSQMGVKDLDLDCNGVGSWSVGALLWELAYGTTPFPGYPVVEEGMEEEEKEEEEEVEGRSLHCPYYSMKHLPPLQGRVGRVEEYSGGDQSPSPRAASEGGVGGVDSASLSPKRLRISRAAAAGGGGGGGGGGSSRSIPSSTPYPTAFIGTILSLMEPNPAHRMGSEAALALIEGLEPRYFPAGEEEEVVEEGRKGGFTLSQLTQGGGGRGVLQGLFMGEKGGKDVLSTPSHPFLLLRSWTGQCRLVSTVSSAFDAPFEEFVESRWHLGVKLTLGSSGGSGSTRGGGEGERGGGTASPSGSTLPWDSATEDESESGSGGAGGKGRGGSGSGSGRRVLRDPVSVVGARCFIGGFEVPRGMSLGEVLKTGAKQQQQQQERGELVVIDLAPSACASSVISALRHIQSCTITRGGSSSPTTATTTSSTHLTTPILHRILLSLTAFSNAALIAPAPVPTTSPLDSRQAFPFVPAARLALLALSPPHSASHDTVSAAAGLLRNVSCVDEVVLAREMYGAGVLAATPRAYWGVWGRAGGGSGGAHHGADPRTGEDLTLTASNLLRFKGMHAINRVPLSSLARMATDGVMRSVVVWRAGGHNEGGGGESERLSVEGTLFKSLDQNLRLLRYLLAVSLEKDEEGGEVGVGEEEAGRESLVGVGWEGEAPFHTLPIVDRVAHLCAHGGHALLALATILYYSVTLPSTPPSASTSSSTPTSSSSAAAAATRAETTLTLLCALLMQPTIRVAKVCPFSACAKAMVAYLKWEGRSEGGVSLCAASLRNLACVTMGRGGWEGSADGLLASYEGGAWAREGLATPPTSLIPSSPALSISHSGAPVALEEILTQYAAHGDIAENARCALFNLLILASREAETLVDGASAEAESLRHELEEVTRERDAALSSSASASASASAPPLPSAPMPLPLSLSSISSLSTFSPPAPTSPLLFSRRAGGATMLEQGPEQEEEEEEEQEEEQDVECGSGVGVDLEGAHPANATSSSTIDPMEVALFLAHPTPPHSREGEEGEHHSGEYHGQGGESTLPPRGLSQGAFGGKKSSSWGLRVLGQQGVGSGGGGGGGGGGVAEHSEGGILPSSLGGGTVVERGEMAWAGQGDGSPLGEGDTGGRGAGGGNGALRFRLIAAGALFLLLGLIAVAVVGWVVKK